MALRSYVRSVTETPCIPERLKDEIDHSEQEARMVLPGIQALFGFQLVATFNSSFKTELSQGLQNMHLAALICVALSVMLVLTPAAYHRQAEAGQISKFFAKIASAFLTLSMVPMMLGIVLDIYVIARLVTGNLVFATLLAGFFLAGFTTLWFVFPRIFKRKSASIA